MIYAQVGASGASDSKQCQDSGRLVTQNAVAEARRNLCKQIILPERGYGNVQKRNSALLLVGNTISQLLCSLFVDAIFLVTERKL